MCTIAISYGENGPIFYGFKPGGSHLVTCYDSNSAVIYSTPSRFPFVGLTVGDGFVCGLLMDLNQPSCWGSSAYIQMGVP
ncbi:crinkly4 [Hibiscus trionum]|uniref:non-specific serine/threonine protein kinase n=1 Tax=Hibiscus trionum TaxID=183268 RepID=A0A9W7GT51_HIBTR|nr:crinkly4 [Hibiscus trionum]